MMHGKTHFHCAVLLIFVNYYYSPSLSFLLLRRWLQLQLQRCSKPLPRGRESSFCCPCSMKQAFSARLLQLLLDSPLFIHDKTIFASEASKATSIYLTYFCGIFPNFLALKKVWIFACKMTDQRNLTSLRSLIFKMKLFCCFSVNVWKGWVCIQRGVARLCFQLYRALIICKHLESLSLESPFSLPERRAGSAIFSATATPRNSYTHTNSCPPRYIFLPLRVLHAFTAEGNIRRHHLVFVVIK